MFKSKKGSLIEELNQRMQAIPLVRTSAVLPCVKFLKQIGSPTDRLLQQANLPISALADPEALIPLYQSFTFLEQAARLEGIETLGVLAAQHTPVVQMGTFGKLVCQSLTLYDLLQTITRLQPLYNSGAQVWLTREGEQIWLNHQYHCPARTENRQAQYYALQLYLNVFPLLMGEKWKLDKLQIQASPVKGLADLALFSNIPIDFNHSHNAIGFSASLLSLPLKPSVTSSILPSPSDIEALQSSAPATDFLDALQQLIRSLVQDGYPSLNLVATAAEMSTRSLQRRLMQNGVTYSHLVDQVRFEIAVNLLKDPRIKLIEIVSELGFTDAANFTRAFKRWTGVSPREFRRLHLDKSN